MCFYNEFVVKCSTLDHHGKRKDDSHFAIAPNFPMKFIAARANIFKFVLLSEVELPDAPLVAAPPAAQPCKHIE